jgi:hypothetical protein
MLLVVNELLCFLSTHSHGNLDRENLFSTLWEFYTINEATDAKEILINECEKLTITDSIKEFTAKRQTSKPQIGLQKIVNNILDIWFTIDKEKGGLTTIKFVASGLNRIPSVSTDKFNLKFLISSILKLQEQVTSQGSTLTSVNESLAEVNKHLASQPKPSVVASVTASPSKSTSEGPTPGKRRKLLVTATSFFPQAKQKNRTEKSPAPVAPSVAPGSSQSPSAPQAAVSFAEKAKGLQNGSNSWNLVTARKKRKIVTVTGVGDNSILEGVEPIKQDFWDVFVSRLHESTTEDKVKSLLTKHDITAREISVFPSRIKGCKSAKICIAIANREKIKNENIWPCFVRVQDWVKKPKSARHSSSVEERKSS